MAYSKQTTDYGIPYPSDNEIIQGADEEIAAEIINNQLRAGVLGAGGNRVFQDGVFTAQIVDTVLGTVEVTLAPSGSNLPSVQGIAAEGLIEIFDNVVWTNLNANTFYYLYLQSINNTYIFPDSVNIISSQTPLTNQVYLFLATVDTTGSDVLTAPIIDPSPPGKPTAFNLFNLLNNNHDPFGPELTQSVLTVLQQFSVLTSAGVTSLFQQLNVDATLPVITIQNHSNQPDIYSSVGPLLLSDIYVPAGFALSDQVNIAYHGLATSIIGALNEVLTQVITHINDNQDPHGETLYQTNLVLGSLLTVPQLLITPPPPAPPGPPLPPGQLSYLDLRSSGELRIGDLRGGLYWSDPGNPYYLGAGASLMGALNELLELINTLSGVVGGITGSTLQALGPVVFEITPEDIGLNLHFKVIISLAEDFSNIIVTKESKTSTTGWFYEYQPPAPPLPPSPPADPYALPGIFTIPVPADLPSWVALPSDGLPESLQYHPDGRPVRVKYETQPGDLVYSRNRYSVSVQEYNGIYGDSELAAITFD